MKTLSIETSNRLGEVAILEHGRIIVQQILDPDSNTAESLAPTIVELLEDNDWPSNKLDLICVTSGPGSFTGLRVGVTTAKVMAFATGANVVGVNSLLAIAHAAAETPEQPVHVIMNAQRRQLFFASFVVRPEGGLMETAATRIVDRHTFLDSICEGDMVVGDGIRLIEDELNALNDIQLAAPELWRPTALAVGEIGCREALMGKFSDVWALVPEYFRLSAAEEKAKQGT